jgi:hypothetical protein
MSTPHQNFIKGLRESFEQAGYKNTELNGIIIDQFNAYYQQIQEFLELEETIRDLSNQIKELKSGKK